MAFGVSAADCAASAGRAKLPAGCDLDIIDSENSGCCSGASLNPRARLRAIKSSDRRIAQRPSSELSGR